MEAFSLVNLQFTPASERPCLSPRIQRYPSSNMMPSSFSHALLGLYHVLETLMLIEHFYFRFQSMEYNLSKLNGVNKIKRKVDNNESYNKLKKHIPF